MSRKGPHERFPKSGYHVCLYVGQHVTGALCAPKKPLDLVGLVELGKLWASRTLCLVSCTVPGSPLGGDSPLGARSLEAPFTTRYAVRQWI